MSTTTKEIVHQGWLTKSPPTKAIFRPRWRRRWFLLKSGSYPNQFVLEYFTDESCRRQKGSINLDECEQVAGPLNVQDRHRYTFQLRTPSRTYYLATDSEHEMNKWVQGICQVCGLKITEDDGNIVYARPSNEITPESHNNDSDGSSSPTSPSVGPYIPISECITGKPIQDGVTYYNTNMFQGLARTSNDSQYVPPRPPKKNSSKPTTPTLTKWPEESLGVYENVDEAPDSASLNQTPAVCSGPPSPPGAPGPPPPKVDRKLKPEVKKANQVSAALKTHHLTMCATTPRAGPLISPHDKKPEVQKASQVSATALKTHHHIKCATTPRAGPLISPHDKKPPTYHEYETAQELSGTYMQIDCKAIKEAESKSQSLKHPPTKKLGGVIAPSEGSVEYRLIDHVKTKALNQMRLDREKQLQTNTTRH